MLDFGFGGLPGPFPARRRGPTLDMDFTKGTMPSGLTFTRAGGGGRINSSGLYEWVGADVPRFDYDPVTLACKGLLIEERRTSGIVYSRDYNNAWWSKNVAGSLTITSDAEMSPDGTTSTDRFATSAASCGVYRSGAHTDLSIGMQVTATVLVKPLSDYCKIRFGYSGTAFPTVQSGVFDLVAGTHTVYGADNIRSMVQRPDGYWVVTLTATATAAGSATMSIYAYDDTPMTFAVDHCWSEIGAFGTSFIPTAGSPITRAADVLTMTGVDFSRWFNPLEGTFVVDFERRPLGVFGVFVSVHRSAAGYGPRQYIYAGPSNSVVYSVINDDLEQPVILLAGSIPASGRCQFAVGYKTNDFAASLNGAAAVADASGALPTGLDFISFGSDDAGGARINGHLRRIRYYPRRLDNTRLQELSA